MFFIETVPVWCMANHRGIDYSTWTKRSFLFGAGLFALAAITKVVGHAYFGSLPRWEETLLVDAEIIGILVALLAPLLFGIILPLTE
jgi:hypothetical protein